MDLNTEYDNWNFLRSKMRHEGIDYCFRKYSNFEWINDKEFQKLREEYVVITNKLENYVNNKFKIILEKLDENE